MAVTRMPATTSTTPAHCAAVTLARSSTTAMAQEKTVTLLWKMVKSK